MSYLELNLLKNKDVATRILRMLEFDDQKKMRLLSKSCNQIVLQIWSNIWFKLFKKSQPKQEEYNRYRNFDLSLERDRHPVFNVSNVGFFEKNGLTKFFIDYPCPTMLKKLCLFATSIIFDTRGFTLTCHEKDLLKIVAHVEIL